MSQFTSRVAFALLGVFALSLGGILRVLAQTTESPPLYPPTATESDATSYQEPTPDDPPTLVPGDPTPPHIGCDIADSEPGDPGSTVARWAGPARGKHPPAIEVWPITSTPVEYWLEYEASFGTLSYRWQRGPFAWSGHALQEVEIPGVALRQHATQRCFDTTITIRFVARRLDNGQTVERVSLPFLTIRPGLDGAAYILSDGERSRPPFVSTESFCREWSPGGQMRPEDTDDGIVTGVSPPL